MTKAEFDKVANEVMVDSLSSLPETTDKNTKVMLSLFLSAYIGSLANELSFDTARGKWIEENSETGALGIKYTWFRCNQCGWNNSLVIPRNYCPNCGARMEANNET